MEIKKHLLLREVFFRVFTGKWDDIKEVSEDMKPYFYRKNEFSIEKGFLLWGHRLVIPPRFRTALEAELHNTQMGKKLNHDLDQLVYTHLTLIMLIILK